MRDTHDAKDLQNFLDIRLQTLIAEANEAGFGTADILAGLSHAVEQQRLAYDSDPDPADEPGLEAARAAKVRLPDEVRRSRH